MKNIVHSLLIIMIGMNLVAGDGKFSGSVSLESQTFKNLTVSGSASLEDVTVSEYLSVSGSLSAEDCDFNHAKVSGAANLEGTTVNGLLSVSGACNAESSKLYDVVVSGSCSMEDCTIENTLKVSGALNLEDSEVYCDILVASQDSCIERTIVHGSIVIEDVSSWSLFGLFTSKKEKQIRLKEATVLGDIEFKGAPGVVILHSGSKIAGKVINGSIVKK